MEAGPRMSSTQGAARIDGRRERTSVGEASSITTPQSSQAGATEQPGDQEDWLYLATADPASQLKKVGADVFHDKYDNGAGTVVDHAIVTPSGNSRLTQNIKPNK